MAEKTTSQTQHDSLGFDPMALWARFAQDSITRVQAYYDELAGFEAKAYERAKVATNQMADLANETINYVTRLSAEWRQMTIDATKRGAELFRARA